MFLFPKSGIKYQLRKTEKHCNVTIYRSDHKNIYTQTVKEKARKKKRKEKKTYKHQLHKLGHEQNK